jgi:internalin A
MTPWKPLPLLAIALALLLIAGIAAELHVMTRPVILSAGASEDGAPADEPPVFLQHPSVLIGRISAEVGLGDIADPDLIRLLDLSVATGVDLNDLARFLNVTQIELALEGATDLAVLAKLGKLEQIAIHLSSPQAQDLSVLSQVPELRKITLRNVLTDNVDDLAGLINLRFLTILNGEVADLGGVAGSRKLQSLIIDNFSIPEGVSQSGEPYMGEALAAYDLASATTLDLARLGEKPELRTLVVIGSQVAGLQHLGQLPELHALWLLRAGLADVCEVSKLRHLKDLRLAYNDGISGVTPLAHLLDLETLNLRGTKIANLGMILALPRLENLDLRDTPAATRRLVAVPQSVNVLQ